MRVENQEGESGGGVRKIKGGREGGGGGGEKRKGISDVQTLAIGKVQFGKKTMALANNRGGDLRSILSPLFLPAHAPRPPSDRYHEYSIFPWMGKVPVKTAISSINVSLQGQRLSCKYAPIPRTSYLRVSYRTDMINISVYRSTEQRFHGRNARTERSPQSKLFDYHCLTVERIRSYCVRGVFVSVSDGLDLLEENETIACRTGTRAILFLDGISFRGRPSCVWKINGNLEATINKNINALKENRSQNATRWDDITFIFQEQDTEISKQA